MDPHTLTVLEFEKITLFLKSFATSPLGEKACDLLAPLTDIHEIRTLLEETSELKEILEVHEHLPIEGIRDAEDVVSKTRIEGFCLESKDLLDIRADLEIARHLKRYIASLGTKYAQLRQITDEIVPLKSIEDEVRGVIGPQGEILDSASPELKDIRKRIKSLRNQIKRTLEKMLRDEELDFVFQEKLITIRSGRYVLPVRTDSKSYLPGVVHDQSHTKATYFIEPLTVVDLNNELQILLKEEAREERKILANLTEHVRAHYSEITTNLSLLGRIDCIYARARLSEAMDGCAPRLNTRGMVDMIQARHPILLARFEKTKEAEEGGAEEGEGEGRWFFDDPDVVPVDVRMRPGIDTLIITGANAGGKTVTLKTLGLLSLMTQAGIHIPAHPGSEIGIFESVFADIGDEQNIEEHLSTFSAHMLQVNFILKRANDRSLVLLDELGSGTDPSEGEALALAILDLLREAKVHIAVTSHLNLLKTYAYLHGDVENVSVAFDPETLRPTFNLIYGSPGMSNALAIAKNLGLSSEIIERAEQYLGERDKHLIELIKGLEYNQRTLVLTQEEINKIRGKIHHHESEARVLVDAIKKRRTRILEDFEEEVRQKMRAAEARLKEILDKAAKDQRLTAREPKAKLKKVKEELYRQFPPREHPREPLTHLEAGQAVRLLPLGKEGIVTEVQPSLKRAEVQVGKLRMRAAYHEMELLKGKDAQKVKAQKEKLKPFQDEQWVHELMERATQKLNVIGMTADEAISLIDKTIDYALMSGLERLEIIHGLGTGRLKKAVREHLKNHSAIKGFASGDPSRGGEGITCAELKA